VDKSIIIPYSLRKLLVCSSNYSIVADFQYLAYLMSWQIPNLLIIRTVNVPPMLTLVKVYVKSLNAFVLLEEKNDLTFVILILACYANFLDSSIYM
jgi:hypothetical protein